MFNMHFRIIEILLKGFQQTVVSMPTHLLRSLLCHSNFGSRMQSTDF